VEPQGRRSLGDWLFVICGIWLVGLGSYFIFIRPPLLPEDLRYSGANALVLQAAAPRIAEWLDLVFTVMGGFMAAVGVLVGYIGWAVLPRRPKGAAPALLLAGLLSVGLMSAVNFALNSDFRWLLVLPPIAWAAGVFLYLRQPNR